MSHQTETMPITELEPRDVWAFFAGIASVPRPSKKEERIRKHVCDIAKQHGFVARTDDGGNVVIEVPATSGLEKAPITVLQAHLDMVCEKNAGTEHDFDADPIRLIIQQSADAEGTIVHADGTTLGADNGMGVAMALAAACSPEVKHGPLELLFTIDEEAGMSGVKALTASSFKGRQLLNLDSEEDDKLYIGCAGGCDTILRWKFNTHSPGGMMKPYVLSVTGLRGGHSGGDIHENRGNAVKMLVRAIRLAGDGGIQLAAIKAGSLRNAIPREAVATVLVDDAMAELLLKSAARVADEAKSEAGEADAVVAFIPASSNVPNVAIGIEETAALMRALDAIPNGVLGMHRQLANLVETSNNLATVSMRTDGDGVEVEACTLSRSSSAFRLSELLSRIRSVGELSGADVQASNGYPGWSPNPESPLVETCSRIYLDLFGSRPDVCAIHAGLECGLLAELDKEMDLVSLGPRIEGAHSPDERVYVSSVQKSWKFLQAILKKLAGI